MTSTPDTDIPPADKAITDATNRQTVSTDVGYLTASETELAVRAEATALRNALRLNGEFSTITGLIALIGAAPLANLFDLRQTWLVALVGASLLVFAVSLFLIAGQRTMFVRSEAAVISAADLGWVLGTVGIIAAGWLSTEGEIVMAVLALPVLALAIVQLRARARLSAALAAVTADGTAAGRDLNEFRRWNLSGVAECFRWHPTVCGRS